MRKSGIITLLLAILGGLTGYVIASGTFASYFDSQNRIKDSIVLQNMKENMLVDISLANRDELEKKIDSYLNDPAFFDVEGIFVERKGGSRFLLSRFKDDLVEKNVQSTLSEILSNPAPMKGSFSRPGKENSIIYYVHRREIPARNILPGKVSRNNAYTFGFIKNNSYAQIRQNNFAMTIGWIVSGTVMLISFLFNIVSTYRIDEEKRKLSICIDDIFNNRAANFSLDNPFRDEIIKIVGLFNENNDLLKRISISDEKMQLLEKQNRDLLVRVDSSTRELKELSTQRLKLEHTIQTLSSRIRNFVEIQREKLWDCLQSVDKVQNHGIFPVISFHSDLPALERETSEIISLADELSTIWDKKETIQNFVTQLPSQISDLASLHEKERILHKLKGVYRSSVRAGEGSEELQQICGALEKNLDDIKVLAMKNRLLISQSYKAFMEKTGALRKRVDAGDPVNIDDIDGVHHSYRVTLASFRDFVDAISLSAGEIQFRPVTGNFNDTKELTEELIKEIETLRNSAEEREKTASSTAEKGVDVLNQTIELYYRYIVNFNRDLFQSNISKSKQSLQLMNNMQEWHNNLAHTINELQTLSEEITREIY